MAATVFGIILFAMSRSTSSGQSYNLVVWGTVPSGIFDTALKNSSLKGSKTISVDYVQKDVSTFDKDFVEALAEGRGPDVVVLRDDLVYKNRNKLIPIPYTSYTQRLYKDTFIQAGEVFLSPDGILAVPFTIDPLVMYWNRTIFSNNMISSAPKYWDEIYSLVEKTTKRDSNANVLQSTIALGDWANIVNAKDIVSMLLLQAGTPIISRGSDGNPESVLNTRFSQSVVPSQSAINFYTQFANPTSPTYTWNRSLPNSFNMFLSGKLATYIGYSSEIFSIQQKNPNLDFDVTRVPQIRETNSKSVFGRMHAFAIVKQSKQIAGAFAVINALTEPGALTALGSLTNLPPVRRDLLSEKQTDAFRSVFYDSALIARSWLDPDSVATENIFRGMIESISNGSSRVSEALDNADSELKDLLR